MINFSARLAQTVFCLNLLYLFVQLKDQIVIKEYITNNRQGGEETFKGVYERLDSKIEQYESTIGHLTNELKAAKKAELPYKQIASEIAAVYPEIKHLHIGQGAHVAIDSHNVSPCIIIKVSTETLMSEAKLEQFRNWLKARLQADNVEVYNEATD